MGGLSIGKGFGYSLPSTSGGGGGGGGGGFDEVDEYEVAVDGETVFLTSLALNPQKSKHMVAVNGRIMRRDVDYDVVPGGIQFRYGITSDSVVVVYYVVLT